MGEGDAKVPKAARTAINYLTIVACALLGFGVSNKFLRLGARIRDVLKKFNLTKGPDDAKYIGGAFAIVVYLFGLIYGWKTDQIWGDAVLGYSLGSIIDEGMALTG